ncbi:MAG: hypothetical protein PHT40_04065 [Patescibacteria group bacterium]|nr:hypothetical protein [Patescibacteria group bacterium]
MRKKHKFSIVRAKFDAQIFNNLRLTKKEIDNAIRILLTECTPCIFTSVAGDKITAKEHTPYQKKGLWIFPFSFRKTNK